MMPGMDGYATMRAMRALPETGDLPLVAFTAKVEDGERQRCIDAGASSYVSKPVDTAQLLAVLGEWLPAGPATAEAVIRRWPPSTVITGPTVSPAPAILIVDDNADKRVALRAMLAPLGPHDRRGRVRTRPRCRRPCTRPSR